MSAAPRPAALGIALLLVAAAGSGGCGFHLRGEVAPRPELARTLLEADRLPPGFRHQLAQALERSGIELVEAPGDATGILTVLDTRRERRVLSVGSDAKVVEYELIERIEIGARTSEGDVILEPRSLSARRSYTFDRDLVLGTQGEETLLYEDMEQELIRLVLLSVQRP
jgi:LPS-assembly lipoprotein